MARVAEKEAARRAAAAKTKQGGGGGEGEVSDRFGKKIAQGLDPLASLANAMKLGSQAALKKRYFDKILKKIPNISILHHF